MNEKEISKLKELGFNEQKKDHWVKEIDNDLTAFWDFRKSVKGRFYVGLKGGGFESDLVSKARDEYINFRDIQNGKDDDNIVVTPGYKVKDNPSVLHSKDIVLRGNESDINRVVSSRRLDMISKVSKDGVGEGVLYHNLGRSLGMEPSAQLVDMITADMGNIYTEIVESGMHRHVDINDGSEYQTYYAVVRATDTVSGTSGLGTSEEIIDFDEMKKQGRTFALTKAIRKAERNAKERLIPVPRKALVELVKNIMSEHKNKK